MMWIPAVIAKAEEATARFMAAYSKIAAVDIIIAISALILSLIVIRLL